MVSTPGSGYSGSAGPMPVFQSGPPQLSSQCSIDKSDEQMKNDLVRQSKLYLPNSCFLAVQDGADS